MIRVFVWAVALCSYSAPVSAAREPPPSGSPAARALSMLQRGDSLGALELLREADENSPRVQAALGVAALDQNQYAEAERAARRAMNLSPGKRGNAITLAARPVRGAALLNLGRFKESSNEFSRLLRTGGDARLDIDMHSVKLFTRARSEGLGEHAKAAKLLLKYCKARFSKRRRDSKKREGFREDSSIDAFHCFENVGIMFVRAGSSAEAAATFDLALAERKNDNGFLMSFAPGVFSRMLLKMDNDDDSPEKSGISHHFPPVKGDILKVFDTNSINGAARMLPVRVLSQSPYPAVFIVDDFLTAEEQDSLRSGLQRSKASLLNVSNPLVCLSNVHPMRQEFMEAVIGKKHGFTVDQKVCANASTLAATPLLDKLQWSSSAFIEKGDAWLESKIERALGLNPVHAYPTQLLEYGGKAENNNIGIVDYKRHTDCGGELDVNERAITLLIYLTSADDETGGGAGYTVFPRITSGANSQDDGLAIRPVAGRLVGFTSLTDRGFCDPNSQHYSRGGYGGAGKSKIAVQKWYTRSRQRASKTAPNRLAQKFLHDVKERGLLHDGQAFVSCDGSGSCREFVPWAGEEEGGEKAAVGVSARGGVTKEL